MAGVMTPVAVFVLIVLAGYLMLIAAASVAGALARGGRRERALDSYEALALSRFTIPVSLVVPAKGGDTRLAGTVASLLALKYPELEVIVVGDALPETMLSDLKAQWGLQPKELFYRRTLETSTVHRIYGSGRDSRLMLVDKASGGTADALNCGVSLARFRYVVTLSPDVQCDANALLRLMAPALRDPAAVLAVTSYTERRGAFADATCGGSETDAAWTRATDDYQRLASLRSWLASRLAWHQLKCGIPPREGAVAWRRDAVLELGGFSTSAADPQLDLLVRLQVSRTERAEGRVVRSTEVFGHSLATTVTHHAKVTTRRQRALVEALKAFRGAQQAPGRRTLMILLSLELATPVAQVLILALALAGSLAGWVPWVIPFVVVLMLTFGYGLVSASALLLRGGTPEAPSGKDLFRMLLRAPLEFAVYRPALVWESLRNRSL